MKLTKNYLKQLIQECQNELIIEQRLWNKNQSSPEWVRKMNRIRSIWNTTPNNIRKKIFKQNIDALEQGFKNKDFWECPGCGENIIISDLQRVKDKDGSIDFWRYKCKNCKSILNVMNY